MSDGTAAWLAPNPYHHSETPMMSLQGDMGPVYTQQPMDSENQENARGQSPDPWTGWNTTTIGSGSHGGDTPNPGHDTNGHRTPPAQGPTSA